MYVPVIICLILIQIFFCSENALADGFDGIIILDNLGKNFTHFKLFVWKKYNTFLTQFQSYQNHLNNSFHVKTFIKHSITILGKYIVSK